ncbi:antibiotic biosynthesis monooxygenase family protein [Budvicia diplopodorum]|uniref:antibiotic biosynthesis monooxygenase family protein n=1 Tax=Budvicia diplopodorum TaxID=1119056 RepID=UPI00135A26F9|nr:antibiotic biosynthesis monooxygenase [Budvicia diplopodorum]
MIAVIFEVEIHPQHKNEYLELAAKLRPLLDEIDGFISIERFESLSIPGKILSLSYWQNEQAVEQWRNLHLHRQAQTKGQQFIFKGYQLRVAGVMRDYGMNDRLQAPEDGHCLHG